MPRLLVLLNTVATTGNNSFLIVEKSRTLTMIGSDLKDASTKEGAGDSIAITTIGSISIGIALVTTFVKMKGIGDR